jgi:MoaA/NifB/PqqE/SkfB family radical SAM enzyme
MYKYEEIKAVDIELTERCQAACPMCPRTGNKSLVLSELYLDDIKNYFDKKFIEQLLDFCFCGNFGEPIVARDFLEIVAYLKKCNPDIYISVHTNGGARSKQWWSDLGKIIGSNGHVVFSIDGLKDTNHMYRVNVNYERVIENAKTYIQSGGNARWDFIAFKHNEHQIEEARQIASKIGFDRFRVKASYRFSDKIWRNKSNLGIAPSTKYLNNNDVLLNENDFFDSVEIDCLVKNKKQIFVSASGYVFPCCWIGGQVYDKSKEQFWDLLNLKKIDLRINSLEHIFNSNYFYEIEKLWKRKSIKEGKPLLCSKQCGKNKNLWKSQFS